MPKGHISESGNEVKFINPVSDDDELSSSDRGGSKSPTVKTKKAKKLKNAREHSNPLHEFEEDQFEKATRASTFEDEPPSPNRQARTAKSGEPRTPGEPPARMLGVTKVGLVPESVEREDALASNEADEELFEHISEVRINRISQYQCSTFVCDQIPSKVRERRSPWTPVQTCENSTLLFERRAEYASAFSLVGAERSPPR
jgi:hypothetical protein